LPRQSGKDDGKGHQVVVTVTTNKHQIRNPVQSQNNALPPLHPSAFVTVGNPALHPHFSLLASHACARRHSLPDLPSGRGLCCLQRRTDTAILIAVTVLRHQTGTRTTAAMPIVSELFKSFRKGDVTLVAVQTHNTLTHARRHTAQQPYAAHASKPIQTDAND
jgi:hypothetical protein